MAIGSDFILPDFLRMNEPHIFHMDDLFIRWQAHQHVGRIKTFLARGEVAREIGFVGIDAETT